MKLDTRMLLDTLQLAPADVPVALILEGSWWQQQRNRWRLAALEQVRELPFPELHLGWHQGIPVLYSCVYGAPRAVEPVHIFAGLGSRLAIVIGSCGAIQPAIKTGDIILPTRVHVGEGASQYYSPEAWAYPTHRWVRRAAQAFIARGFAVHQGSFLTTSALFAQPPARVRAWQSAGYLGVDMETSAVLTAARALGLEAVAMVFAWDELHRGRSFLDPYTPAEQAAQERANSAIFEVALELVTQVVEVS